MPPPRRRSWKQKSENQTSHPTNRIFSRISKSSWKETSKKRSNSPRLISKSKSRTDGYQLPMVSPPPPLSPSILFCPVFFGVVGSIRTTEPPNTHTPLSALLCTCAALREQREQTTARERRILTLLNSGPYHEDGIARKRKNRKRGERVHAGMRERVHILHNQRRYSLPLFFFFFFFLFLPIPHLPPFRHRGCHITRPGMCCRLQRTLFHVKKKKNPPQPLFCCTDEMDKIKLTNRLVPNVGVKPQPRRNANRKNAKPSMAKTFCSP